MYKYCQLRENDTTVDAANIEGTKLMEIGPCGLHPDSNRTTIPPKTTSAMVTSSTTSMVENAEDVIDKIFGDDRFSQLKDFITGAKITKADLEDITPVTIFAPDNDAFAKLTEEQLRAVEDPQAKRNIVFDHIVPSRNLTSSQMIGG